MVRVGFEVSRQMKILLAEDDSDDRDLFLEAISIVDPGVSVATVGDGEGLMTYLINAGRFPDCIFLDLNMPKKSGKECLAEIRKDHRTRNIPVVIYTTSLNARDVDETFQYGASCFIRKPNTFGELIQLLKRVFTASFPSSAVKQDFVLNAR